MHVNSFFGGTIGGIVLQLGIGVISGNAIYRIRVIENIILMTIITSFGFAKFDCGSVKCADEEQRYALDNLRILSWIIAGWVAVVTHFIVSIFVGNMIDDEYEFNATTVAEDVQKELVRLEDLAKNSRMVEAKFGLKKKGYEKCEKCRATMIPLYPKDARSGFSYCKTCKKDEKSQIIFWCDRCWESVCMKCSSYPWKAECINFTVGQTQTVEMETVEN